MQKRCIVFAGAEINDISELNTDNAFIICADGGYDNALKFGIKPDIVIGDFDTADIDSVKDCKKIVYPVEKDDTDTMIAVKTALERGYSEIDIIGALGGRFDHTVANIQTLVYIAEHGANGRIIGDNDLIEILKNGSRIYKRRDGYKFSIFSMTHRCEGVTTTGTKYNLENAVLSYDFPLGVSNDIIEDECSVEVKSGVLLIIFSKDANRF